jgi:Flp pilus assembly pilin Flp
MIKYITRFIKEEDGIGTLEMLLIVAILVALAIVFRKWIFSWVNELFENTQNQLADDSAILHEP